MRYKSPLLCRGTHRLRGHTLKLNAKQRLAVWESEKDRKQKLLRHCTLLKRHISGGKFASPRDIRAEVTMTCLWDLVGEVMVVQLCQIT